MTFLKNFTSKKKYPKSTGVDNTPEVQRVVDENGNIEIKSKNFTMTPTKTEVLTQDEIVPEWSCWGCGKKCNKIICPICGKRKPD